MDVSVCVSLSLRSHNNDASQHQATKHQRHGTRHMGARTKDNEQRLALIYEHEISVLGQIFFRDPVHLLLCSDKREGERWIGFGFGSV